MPLLAPIPPGTLLENRYNVVRFIGHGGFGRTYLVQDQHRFNEPCMLKEFAPQVSQAAVLEKATELFQREAGTLYKLNHPQIPEFRALSSVQYAGENVLFLVEQFIDGHNYGEWLEQGQVFSEAQAVQLLQDVLPVLTYIHRMGVIHRDISPDNLMHDRVTGKPILIDFGSVKQVTETALRLIGSPIPATQIHKPGYTPFEQIKGEVYPNSDLYALAVTLLVLMTGKGPTELFSPQTNEWDWQPYLQLNPRFENVLHRMLARHTHDRYPSAEAVTEAIVGLAGAAITPLVITQTEGVQAAIVETSIAPPTAPPPTNLAAPDTPPIVPSSAYSTIKTVAVAPAWKPPPPTDFRPSKARPEKVQPEKARAVAQPIAAPIAAQPVAGTGYAAHSPEFAAAAAAFDPEVEYADRPRRWSVGKLLWGLVLLPFRCLKWSFKLLWRGIRLIDMMFNWMTRLIVILLLLGGGAIASTIGKPDWLPNISLPQFPQFSQSQSTGQGCRDLEGRATRSGLGYAELNRRVNEQFYRKYPQVKGRALTNSEADQPLRDAWCVIADGVLKKAER
ncbi:MAG: hypothetical protein RLZZ511_1039 [Cyanobacteriota bacterium]|jgi:serine/threonine-protein kinase